MKEKKEEKKKGIEDTTKIWFERAKYSALGLEMGLSVVLGYFLGKWGDEYLGTTPWLMFFGVVLGFVAGLRSVIRLVRNYQKNEKQKEEEKEKNSQSQN